MEYELERTRLDGYDLLLDTDLAREETLELIVPDACPDILRIIETDGSALLLGKSVQSGRGELEGSLRLEVLYQPDGEEGVRRLPVTIPFTCMVEDPAITPECRLHAEMRLLRADARAVNPRKVLARGEALAEVRIYAPLHQEPGCRLLTEGEGTHVEQLVEPSRVYLTDEVTEQEFEISQSLPISSGKPAGLELLKCRAELCEGECKLIGSKLIFKGDVRLCVVYRGADQRIYTTGGELPYSQIMEVSGAGENADCDLTLAIQELDCRLDPDSEGRCVETELRVLAQAVVREERSLDLLTDAYSTEKTLCCQRCQLKVQQRYDQGSRSQNVRELWETTETVQEVLDSRVTVGRLDRSREGDRLVLTAQVEAEVLYLAEDGGAYATQRQFSVPCALELPELCRCLCRCREVGEAYAAPAAGGVECRFALDFDYCALAPDTLHVLEELTAGEEPEESGPRPSLVLRALEGGERLWDVAKAYQTTTADIISANELEDEAEAKGRLLLIPRKR